VTDIGRVELSRRQLLKAGAVAAIGLSGALTSCATVPAKPDPGAPQQRGGVFTHGATGGGLKDTLDPHFPVTVPDIARVNNLYEPLFRYDEKYQVQPLLAESFEPSKDATAWTLRLRKDVEFHHGKPLRAEDVIATFQRVMDPDNPAPPASDLGMIDLKNTKALDPFTVRFSLTEPYALLTDLFAAYALGIVPTDFDLAKPVGTGPFRYADFVPGQQSRFLRFADYAGEPAFVDELVIYDFSDDAAKVNALLAGQVQSVDNLPAYLVDSLADQGASPLISETGAWTPFTMRVDAKPYSDVRVRQALRLIVDRQQMIDQALSGYGDLANDLYAPFDEAYAAHLPQREQDIDQARSLLKAAGHTGLQVELTTSSAVGAGAVESANVFAEQARPAGVDVRVVKADPNTFYGDSYLTWPFAQDFWFTRKYLPQVAASSLPTSPYNETHFDDPEFQQLIKQARGELDRAKRNDLLHAAQEIEYERGGFIIWGFKKQVDAYSNVVQGFVPDRTLPMSSFQFKRVSLS
jgi:peptide/nickel transport system substrate-binding protein